MNKQAYVLLMVGLRVPPRNKDDKNGRLSVAPEFRPCTHRELLCCHDAVPKSVNMLVLTELNMSCCAIARTGCEKQLEGVIVCRFQKNGAAS